MNALVSLKVPTKGSFKVKTLPKLALSGTILKPKQMSAMRPKEFHLFGWSCLATNCLEIRAHVSLKVATNDSFRDEKEKLLRRQLHLFWKWVTGSTESSHQIFYKKHWKFSSLEAIFLWTFLLYLANKLVPSAILCPSQLQLLSSITLFSATVVLAQYAFVQHKF